MILNGGNPVTFEVEPVGDGLYTVRLLCHTCIGIRSILLGQGAWRRRTILGYRTITNSSSPRSTRQTHQRTI